MAQAKLKILGDIEDLKKTTEKAKKILADIGNVDISNEATKKFKRNFEEDLNTVSKSIETKIEAINKKIQEMGKSGVFDNKELRKNIQQVAKLKSQLADINKAKLSVGGAGAGVATGGGGEGLVGKAMAATGFLPGGKLLKTALGLLGIGAGVSAFHARGTKLAQERAGLAALMGEDYEPGIGRYGFRPEERRVRAKSYAQALGRDISGKEMESILERSGMMERAYGVGYETQAEVLRAGRRVGEEDLFKTLMPKAIATGLEGSRMTEFLQMISQNTNTLAEQGITVDTAFFSDLSSYLSKLPFFREDPSRIGRSLLGIDEAFRGEDRYQQAMAVRAIMREGAGDVGSVELRRGLGIFGGGRGTLEKLSNIEAIKKEAGGEEFLKTIGISGSKILQNALQETIGLTEGMNYGGRVLQFKEAFKLESLASAQNLFEMAKEGVDIEKVRDFIEKNRQKSPKEIQERLNKTFSGTNKRILDLDSQVKRAIEAISYLTSTGISGLTSTLGITNENLISLNSKFSFLGGGDRTPEPIIPDTPTTPEAGERWARQFKRKQEIEDSRARFGRRTNGIMMDISPVVRELPNPATPTYMMRDSAREGNFSVQNEILSVLKQMGLNSEKQVEHLENIKNKKEVQKKAPLAMRGIDMQVGI